MNGRRCLLATVTLVAAVVAACSSVSAQTTIEPGQPVVGSLHVIESNLEDQLKHDYDAGLIDPLELANLRRDLDVIKVKEDAYRMRSEGLTEDAAEKISDRLSEFQSRLMEKVGDKGRVATATYVEMR